MFAVGQLLTSHQPVEPVQFVPFPDVPFMPVTCYRKPPDESYELS